MARPATKDSEVYEQLRNLILTNRLQPGQRLREEELCAQFRVTRTPLRLAFRRLEHEGLIVSKPFCGCSVRDVSLEEAVEIFRIREVLEGLAARTVAERAEPAVIERLRRAADATDAAMHRQDWREYLERDAAFHHALVEVSGNRSLRETMEIFNFHLRSFCFQSRFLLHMIDSIREAGLALGRNHGQLLDAIERGPDAAEAALREHVRGARLTIEKAWRQSQPAAQAN